MPQNLPKPSAPRTLPAQHQTTAQSKVNVDVPDGYLAVGYIVGVHGLRGEVKVELYTDFPERFKPGLQLFFGEKLKKMLLSAARPHKTHMLLKFQGVDQREQAELMRNQWLFVDEADAVELDEGEYWEHEILGLLVQTEEGKPLGEIVEILHTGANDVYIVQRGTGQEADNLSSTGELLLPAIADLIQKIDLEAGVMTVRLLPGM